MTEENNQQSTVSGLEVLARMTDSKIEIKEMVKKWTLLTYDIPETEEGKKARINFLRQAAAIGAVRHTDSVYLLPASPEANTIALELAKTKGGQVIVWSQAEPLNDEGEVLRNYDAGLRQELKLLSKRLDRLYEIKGMNRQFLFLKMLDKTDKMFDAAEMAVTRRGNEVMIMHLEILKERYRDLVKR